MLFPKKHDLAFTVRPEKSTYRPGDEATVNFHVSGPEGESLESALGLVVVDRALEERSAPTKSLGKPGLWLSIPLGPRTKALKVSSEKILDNLDLSLPLPEGMALSAEVLLRGRSMYHTSFESDSGHESLRKSMPRRSIGRSGG